VSISVIAAVNESYFFPSSDIYDYVGNNHYIDHVHHYHRLCLHQLICNNSDQSVRVITVIQDTPAITAGGNRGGDKGRHQKSGDERREDEEAHVFEFSRNRPLRSYYD